MTQAKRVQLRRGVSTVTLVLMLTIAVALVAAYAQLLFEPGGTDPTSGEIKSKRGTPGDAVVHGLADRVSAAPSGS